MCAAAADVRPQRLARSATVVELEHRFVLEEEDAQTSHRAVPARVRPMPGGIARLEMPQLRVREFQQGGLHGVRLDQRRLLLLRCIHLPPSVAGNFETILTYRQYSLI